MLKIKIKPTIKEAEGDSKELISINMDFLKKNNPKPAEQSPRDYYQDLNQKATLGVQERFPKSILDFIESVPQQYLPDDGKKYFIKWLANAVKDLGKEPDLEDIRKVKDLFVGNGLKELPNGFKSALDASDKWHEELANKQGTTSGDYVTNDVVHDFGNGFKMVRISHESGDQKAVDHDLKVEGEKMGNCVGTVHCEKVLSSEETIFSLRDAKNEPHVTINLFNQNYRGEEQAGSIDEIKGKANKLPEKKYQEMVIPWIINAFPMESYFYAERKLIPTSSFFKEKAKQILLKKDKDAFPPEFYQELIKITPDGELLKKAFFSLGSGKNDKYLKSEFLYNKNLPIELIKEIYESEISKIQSNAYMLALWINQNNNTEDLINRSYKDFIKNFDNKLSVDTDATIYAIQTYIDNKKTDSKILNDLLSKTMTIQKSGIAHSFIDAFGDKRIEPEPFFEWMHTFLQSFKKSTVKKYINLIQAAEKKRESGVSQEIKENKFFNRMVVLAGINA